MFFAWWLGFFWHAILPSFEALTLQHLTQHPHIYGRIRLWGSVGFIVAVQGVGAMMDLWGETLFWFALLFLFVWMLLSAWWTDAPTLVEASMTHPPTAVSAPHFSVWQVLTTQGMPILMLGVMLMQVSHGVYYAFYSILLAEKGYSTSMIGALWSLGVVAEVVMFLLMHRVFAWKSGLTFWLTFGLAIATLRWLMLAFGSDQIWVLIIVQLFHAVSFALFHTATMQALQTLFPSRGATQAQAWYSSIGYGVGGIIGALIAGYIWSLGYGALSFAFAALSAGLGCIIVWRYWQD
jgi:PPP family 3-phenylpropionic acid transporter